MIECPECGALIESDSRRCPHCGFSARGNYCEYCVHFKSNDGKQSEVEEKGEHACLNNSDTNVWPTKTACVFFSSNGDE